MAYSTAGKMIVCIFKHVPADFDVVQMHFISAAVGIGWPHGNEDNLEHSCEIFFYFILK